MFLGLTQDYAVNTATALAQLDNRQMLINHEGHLHICSNLCPHQGSRLVRTTTNAIKCPYHGLEFELNGAGKQHSYNITRRPLYEISNMLFDQDLDLEKLPVNLAHMQLQQQRVDKVLASVDTIMDVFLDIEHISVAHPGVYQRIGIDFGDQIKTRIFDHGSLQLVPVARINHIISQDKHRDRAQQLGALWLSIYPGTMIEWQPGALIVTMATPGREGMTNVHVRQYKDSRYSDDSYKLNCEVWETAWAQDQDLSENIMHFSMNPDEPLKQHHREWMRNAVR